MFCPKCSSNNVKNIVGDLWLCDDCGHKFVKAETKENDDQSVYSDNPEDTQEDDMEERFDPTNDEGDNSDQLEDDDDFF
jgi:DNA-directed RNA polymerase subunit M/transcription elongation factor TFIIS